MMQRCNDLKGGPMYAMGLVACQVGRSTGSPARAWNDVPKEGARKDRRNFLSQ